MRKSKHQAFKQCDSVPNDVLLELSSIVQQHPGYDRFAIADMFAPKMGKFRFCSCYRHEATAIHSLVYAVISTVEANAVADGAEVSSK